MLSALLLIAHGSRRAEANDELRQVAQRLRATTDYSVVEAAYLELSEPDICGAAARCVASGAQRVILVPYFLSLGRHVVEDLRRARDELARAYPQIEFRLAEPIGRHEQCLAILVAQASAADA